MSKDNEIPCPDALQNLDRNGRDRCLLDRIAEGFNIKSDRELGIRLGISYQTIRRIRKENATLNWKQRFVCMDKLGFLHARAGLEAISPASLASRIRKFTNNTSSNITKSRDKAEYKGNADNNLIEFLIREKRLADNPIFRSNLNISDKALDKRKLTDKDRIAIISALGYLQEDTWNIDQKDLYRLSTSSEQLFEELLNKAATKTSEHEDDNILLDNFKRLVDIKSEKDLADLLDLSDSQLGNIRGGRAHLPPRACLIIACELDKKAGMKDPISLEDIDRLANSTELFWEKLNSE